ncbi:ribonuclease H-like domain-containing protein, partial [Candidatus Woesearchaeota archaeon]|nr:ribonuclease H-like domain-containing protein [Candidatus Woesearchaeota archaeon]
MRVQFYPIDAAARNINGRTAAVLYGKTVSGERICVTDTTCAPFFYVVPKHGSTTELEKWISELKLREKDVDYFVLKVESKAMKLNDKEINVLKIYTNNAFSYYLVNEIKKRNDVSEVFEYDLPFLQAYLLDKRLVPGFLTEAEGEFIAKSARIPVFSASALEQPYDEIIKPRVLAFDVETYSPKGSSSPEHDPVIMISFYSENFKKTITWKKFETTDTSIDFVDSEFELLNRFKRTIYEFKPDYLVGYTSDLFVFPYLKKRADKYGLFFDIGTDKSSANIGRSETSITGIVHIDLYKFISKIISEKLETDSYRLKDVAQELLGETKKTVDIEKLEYTWDNEPSKLGPYCEYNLNDAYLIYRLYEKVAPMMDELVKLTNMFPHDVVRGNYTQYTESFLIKESKFMNEMIPFRPSFEDYESRKTFSSSDELVEAEQGIYNNVFVYDFTLLFPSIIATHNISPGAFNCWCCNEKIPGESTHFCRKVTGFFTRITSAMLDRRKRIVKMLADETEKTSEQMHILSARENALTNISRSLYGVFAYPSSRWHNANCTAAILAYARNYMVSIMNKAIEAGFKILYADFDSIFLRKGVHSVKLSESLYETIVASLPEKMELNHEGIYPRAMFVSSKQGKSMKRFALLN